MKDNRQPFPLPQTKPVNINITFNVGNKQVTQNINPSEHSRTISVKNLENEETSPNLKPKNAFRKPPKTPELICKDKEFELVRPTEEIKRRRKVKRASGDYTLDRTTQLLCFHNEANKSVAGHKRGYSASLVKKSSQQTNEKKKKPTTKVSDQVIRQYRTALLQQPSKQIKSYTAGSKSLKGVITKLVNSQWSKKSLEMCKGKGSQSVTLTGKKTIKPRNKRSSKSQTLVKELNIKEDYCEGKGEQIQRKSSSHHVNINNNQLLEKLAHFKSVENSFLLNEAQRIQEQQQLQTYSESKLISFYKNKIVIQTDQSIDCIDEIHQLERKMFMKEFFEKGRGEDYVSLGKKQDETKELVETYVRIFEREFGNQGEEIQQDGKENKFLEDNSNGIIYDENYLNSSDLVRVDDLLMSPISKKDALTHIPATDNNLNNLSSFMLIEDVQLHHAKQNTRQQDAIQPSYLTKDQISELRVRQNVTHIQTFVKRQENSNQLKNQKTQKWSYLLEYIKTNMEQQVSTQQVLQHVYQQLTKAKSESVNQQYQKLIKIPQKSPQLQAQSIKNQYEQILAEQISCFKDQYESQDNDEDMKFMNLQTIESALKNRLVILNQKKQKQLHKLESLYEQNKLSTTSYKQQKESIEKWFRTQEKQISSVKKNILKGYNEAKGILEKSTINSKFDQAHKTIKKTHQRCGQNHQSNEESLLKKRKKMMKCLSQSYLKKHSNISYKQIQSIDEQAHEETKPLRRQKYMHDSGDSGEKLDYQNKELKEDSNIQLNEEKQYSEIDPWEKQEKSQLSEQEVPCINLLKVENHYTNEFSPAMVQYEEIPKDLREQNNSDFGSDQSFNYYPSSQESQNYPYEYEEQKSLEVDEGKNHLEPSPVSLKSSRSPQASKYHKQPTEIDNQHVQSPSSTKLKDKLLNQLSSKLSQLTSDDRQDIFQFLFLDLCIQLYQEPCANNKIMNQIHTFLDRQVELSKRKKGIRTNLSVVKDYLKRFCGYVLRTNKKVLNNVNVAMGPTAGQMLKYLRQEQADQEVIDDSEDIATIIVPITVFDTFEHSLLPTLQFEKYYDNEEKQFQRINFLKNVMHIHNKAIFDCLNQFLDHERPCGVWGKPFPWKKSTAFDHRFSQVEQQKQKLKKSAQKVVETCSYVCGLLVDKEQSLIGNSKVSPSYIQQIRQDRISKMLANDMIENEERWVFYDDEETEAMVDIANTVYHRLLMEVAGEILFVGRGNK